jgi:dTDP-4-dehydrorhamnose 3,5-epimerase
MIGAIFSDGRSTQESEIVGVSVYPIASIDDVRGSLSEIHRDDWGLAPRPVQWDLVFSHRNVMRGVHVHCLRWDYIIILAGHATIGLKDVRRGQTSFRRTMVIDVIGERPTVVTIPPGVAHGVFANSELRYLYGLSVAWDGSDEDPAVATTIPIWRSRGHRPIRLSYRAISLCRISPPYCAAMSRKPPHAWPWTRRYDGSDRPHSNPRARRNVTARGGQRATTDVTGF